MFNYFVKFVIKGLAFETLGPWCKEAIDFNNVIGNRLIAESGDSKSKKFLFERISLAIQRGNAASISRLGNFIGNFCTVKLKCYVLMFFFFQLLKINSMYFFLIT
jgi:hypothetical protein